MTRCRLCENSALPKQQTCAACTPAFRAWLKGKVQARSVANKRRTERQRERTAPIWESAV